MNAHLTEGTPNLLSNSYDTTLRPLERGESMTTEEPPNIVLKCNKRNFNGWRLGAFCAALAATISLFINIGLVIWLSRYSSSIEGLLQVYRGSCEKVRSTQIWLHLGINALSTLLLGGSNYCMQCLSSPTRHEIDKAHALGLFLDIGVVSVRNLSKFTRWKILMWWMLAISSLPLHLLFVNPGQFLRMLTISSYNSTFYSVLTNNDYEIFLANHTVINPNVSYITIGPSPDSYSQLASHTTSTFNEVTNRCGPDNSSSILSWDLISPPDISVISNEINGSLHRLETPDCIKQYGQSFITNRRNLVLVTKNTTERAVDGFVYLESIHHSNSNFPETWLCCRDPWFDSKTGLAVGLSFHERNGWCIMSCDPQRKSACKANIAKVAAMSDQWTPYGYSVDYCLSEQIGETCSLNANLYIIFVVISCNAIKATIMYIVAFGLRDAPLITIGDAIESFLDTPDHTTVDRCWMGKSDFVRQGWSKDVLLKPNRPRPRPVNALPASTMNLKKQRWRSTVSRSRWINTITVFAFVVLTTSGLLGYGMEQIRAYFMDIQQLGFGQINPVSIVRGWRIRSLSWQISASILIANLPQVVLSFIYYNFNGILTRMWLAAEWASFAKKCQYLRVSNPKGNQRSSHFLHLPYRVGLTLLAASTVFHWVVSQSIFLVVILVYSSSGVRQHQGDIVACGFSPMAIILTLSLGNVALLTLIMLGYRHLESGIPLVGSCSAAISAACHPPRWDDKASLQKVQYGALPDCNVDSMIGHCSFSTGRVQIPTHGKRYAGLPKIDKA